MKRSGGVVVLVCLLSGSAAAGPTVDELLCKRVYDRYDDKKPVVLGINVKDAAASSSPDGARSVQNAPEGKNGFVIVDGKTKKKVAAHNRDKSYDCDTAESDGKANSVRWLGNDVVFAQGWYCEEFDAKPYLVNAKTGKFIGYVKVPVSPEADYLFAPLEGSQWAVAVYEHNSKWNAVVVIDAKSGKIKSTKKATPALIAKLPDCTAK